jgi:hypothetical protein
MPSRGQHRRRPARTSGPRSRRRSACCAAGTAGPELELVSQLVRAAPAAPARQRRCPARRPAPARGNRGGLPVARTLPHRTHARPAGRDQRRGRAAAEGRGLPDPVDDPLGQGPGVEGGVSAQCGRRLHPVRPVTGTTAEIEEERRLLYVAMTRAKDHLTVVVPQRFYVHQQGAAATATSTRRARASFPMRCARGSSGRAGRSPPTNPAPTPGRFPRWIWPRGCAACGREERLIALPVARRRGPARGRNRRHERGHGGESRTMAA